MRKRSVKCGFQRADQPARNAQAQGYCALVQRERRWSANKGQQGLEQKRSVGDTYVAPTFKIKPMRSLLPARCECLREVQRVETDRQEIDRQEEVDASSPIVQLRRDLTHTPGVTWAGAIGWRVERKL